MPERILIGGPSRSGKTTLSNLLRFSYSTKGKRVLVISQDNFDLPENEVPRIRGQPDWEVPQAYDWEKIEKLFLDDRNYEVIIFEGIHAFHSEKMIAATTRIYEIDIPKEEFLEQRRKDKRWGTVSDWYLEHIWTSHLKYGKRK